MRIEIALCLPRDGNSVAIVRAITMDALRRLGVTDECLDDVRLALSEACTNVVQHAGAGDEYEVGFEVDDDQCEIRVIDAGTGLDFSNLVDVQPDPASASGRGVGIMRACVDSVHFSSAPERGTIVHLVKTLSFNEGAPLRSSNG